jgi:hypothetical protein
MASAKPITITQRAAVAGERAPEPVVLVGTLPVSATPSATTGNRGTVLRAASQANSTATDVAGLVTDFNALLAKLRTAGIIAP